MLKAVTRKVAGEHSLATKTFVTSPGSLNSAGGDAFPLKGKSLSGASLIALLGSPAQL